MNARDATPDLRSELTDRPPFGRGELAMVAALLLLHLAVCLHTAWSKSITHDEIWHLPVGLRNLQGDFAADRLNPPLTRMWSALPLKLQGVSVDQQARAPDLGELFVAAHPDDFQKWYFAGRIFNIAWSLTAGLLIFLWARSLWGRNAGFLALVFYVTCPNVIAHASLVTPEIGLTCLFVATLLALWHWTWRRSWRSAALLGVVLGLAQATKFTAIVLYPLCVVLALFLLWPTRRGVPVVWARAAGQFCSALAISIVCLWAAYGFQGVLRPLSEYAFQSSELRTVQELLSFAPATPIPLPRDYLLGIDEQRTIMQGQHPVYLDGQWSLTGFPNYYFKAMLYKTPHLLQVCFLIAAVSFLLGRCGPRHVRQAMLLILPVACLLVIVSREGMQLGIRYLLPALPLIMIFSARIAAGIPEGRNGRIFIGAMALLCLVSLRHHPSHLAYFNEFAGGPRGGRAHLLDSNLDWGQDLNLVKRYMEDEALAEIGLAYFGTQDPRSLGIAYSVPPSRQPAPGRYAVSVNFVMGRPHFLREPGGETRGVDFQEFGYFQAFEPVRTLGGSIDIYEITPEDLRRLGAPGS